MCKRLLLYRLEVDDRLMKANHSEQRAIEQRAPTRSDSVAAIGDRSVQHGASGSDPQPLTAASSRFWRRKVGR